VNGGEELHLDLDRGEAEAVPEHLGVRPSHVAGEEVLEGLVQEVDEVRVVGDPRRVEVAEPYEDAGLEQSPVSVRLADQALEPRCSMIERDRMSPRASNEASPSSALAAVGSPK